MSKELILIESVTAREEAIKKVDDERINELLNKVKSLALLPDNTNVTVEISANYYEVDKELIKYHIKNNKKELLSDGLKVLKGKELKEFKEFLKVGECNYLTPEILTSPSLTLIPRRAILRLGMLIQKSEIAQRIRTYLLDVEENTSNNDKLIALSKSTNNEVLQLNNKLIKMEDKLIQVTEKNDILITNYEEIKYHNITLINKVDELLNQPLFKLYENQSNTYKMLITEFSEIMFDKGVTGASRYVLFNNEFSNWTGCVFNTKVNKKSYWISKYGIGNIKHFIYGVKQGTIVKNKEGNWVDMNGIFCNKIEWRKTLQEFENKCSYCGDDISGILVPEHIRPQTNEKSTDRNYNIICSCVACNRLKGTMDMSKWLKYKGVSEERIYKIRNHWKKYYI